MKPESPAFAQEILFSRPDSGVWRDGKPYAAVFPNAEYKIYLDASSQVRAQRRFDQGVSNLSLEEIKKSIEERDEMDKNKKEGALKIAPDALYIDTSTLTIDKVCEIILKQIS